MMDHLASVTGGYQTFAGYPAIAIVFGSTEQLHMDKSKFFLYHLKIEIPQNSSFTGDCRNTLCTIVPLGDFEGCNLLFPTLNHEVEMRSGDMISFRAHSLPHKTTPLKGGMRFSLVFFADHNLFTTKL